MAVATTFGALAVAGCSMGGEAMPAELPPTKTVPPNDAYTSCVDCHVDLEGGLNASSSVILSFDHIQHAAASGSVGCGSCHPIETHDGTSTIRPDMDACFECHGANEGAPLDCASCHPLSVVPVPPSHLDGDWDHDHGIAVIDEEPECATCHSPKRFCTACHGLEMPHPEGWDGVDHAFSFLEDAEDRCTICHGVDTGTSPRSECAHCHHPGGDPGEPWVTEHPGVVKYDGGGSCFGCHDPATCVTCHVDGIEDMSADWAEIGGAGL
ncbi:MAG: hypothetical protein ABFS21_02880 [Actinomycetota bacterium]